MGSTVKALTVQPASALVSAALLVVGLIACVLTASFSGTGQPLPTIPMAATAISALSVAVAGILPLRATRAVLTGVGAGIWLFFYSIEVMYLDPIPALLLWLVIALIAASVLAGLRDHRLLNMWQTALLVVAGITAGASLCYALAIVSFVTQPFTF
jgi:hypothetical protein